MSAWECLDGVSLIIARILHFLNSSHCRLTHRGKGLFLKKRDTFVIQCRVVFKVTLPLIFGFLSSQRFITPEHKHKYLNKEFVPCEVFFCYVTVKA